MSEWCCPAAGLRVFQANMRWQEFTSTHWLAGIAKQQFCNWAWQETTYLVYYTWGTWKKTDWRADGVGSLSRSWDCVFVKTRYKMTLRFHSVLLVSVWVLSGFPPTVQRLACEGNLGLSSAHRCEWEFERLVVSMHQDRLSTVSWPCRLTDWLFVLWHMKPCLSFRDCHWFSSMWKHWHYVASYGL